MADKTKTLTIRVGAEGSPEVSRVMREIQKSTSDAMKQVRTEAARPVLGPEIKPRFDFQEQLVRNEMARLVRKVREDTERNKIRIQAEAVVRDARGRVYGADTPEAGPLRSVNRSGEEQAVRDRQAEIIRQMRERAREERVEAAARARLFGEEASAAEQIARNPQIRQAARNAGRVQGEEMSKGMLAEIKSQLGARGPFKDVFELLKGGGAVAGLTFGAAVLRDAASEAAKLRAELNAGKISAGEFRERLLQSLPVLGTIRQAGLAIRELFTGEQEALAVATAESERLNASIEARKAAIKRANDGHKESIELIRQLRREQALTGATGGRAERLQQSFADADLRREAQERAKARRKAEDDAFKEQQKPFVDRFTVINAEVDRLSRQALTEGDAAKALDLTREAVGISIAVQSLRAKAQENKRKITEEEQDELAEIANTGAAKRAEMRRREMAEEIKDAKAQAERILRLRRDAVEQSLRNRGYGNSADRYSLFQKHLEESDKIAAEEARLNRERPLDPTSPEAIARSQRFAAEQAAAVSAYGQDAIAQVEEQRARAREQQAEAARQQLENVERLRRARIEELEAEGELGNRVAEIEARKLRIAEEYKRKRDEILAILRDEATSQSDLRDAQDRLAALGRAEARELARVGVDRGPQRFAGIVDGQGLTGIGESMRSNLANRDPFSPVVEATKQQTTEQKNNTTAMKQLDRTMGELLLALRQPGGQTLLTPLFSGR